MKPLEQSLNARQRRIAGSKHYSPDQPWKKKR